MSTDRGSSTVLAIGVVAGLATVLIMALALVAALVAGQQARTAADLAALAAAGRLVEGAGEPAACAVAAQVAEANNAALESCTTRPAGTAPWPEVLVRTSRAVAGTGWTATARAAAGAVPADADGG